MAGLCKGKPLLAVLMTSLVLAGCNQSGRPRGGGEGLSTSVPGTIQGGALRSTSASAPGMREYTVIPGDTVYGVAGRFNVPVRTVIDSNELTAPFRLPAGTRLVIPAPQSHIVQPEDTIWSIAHRYGVDQSTLTRVNDIEPPYIIAVGQQLRLPAVVQTASANIAESTAPAPTPETVPGSAPAPAGAVTVEELPPLAATTPPTASSSEPEAVQSPTPHSVRQTGPVPLPSPRATPSPAAAETAPAQAGSTASTTKPAPAAPEPESLASVSPTLPAAPVAAVPAVVPQPAPLSSGKFLWPVNGRVLSGFGPKDGGLHNDGINIAAPRGTPVRAAENGVVAYAGNELRGFGNLLLIRHADGWMSAYAHNESLLVQRGDKVARGQTIARVGSSGSVSTPQLHFELRRGARSVNPTSHLGEQGAMLNRGAGRDAPPDLG